MYPIQVVPWDADIANPSLFPLVVRLEPMLHPELFPNDQANGTDAALASVSVNSLRGLPIRTPELPASRHPKSRIASPLPGVCTIAERHGARKRWRLNERLDPVARCESVLAIRVCVVRIQKAKAIQREEVTSRIDFRCMEDYQAACQNCDAGLTSHS